MKKILIGVLLTVSSPFIFAKSALPPPAQQLIDLIDVYTFPILLKDENLNKLSLAIMDYHKITKSTLNKNKIKLAIKNYFSDPDVHQQYKANIASIYEKGMTNEEIEEWIKFFNTPVGNSLLKNTAYYQGISETIENLFPPGQAPSAKAQKQIMQLVNPKTQ